MTAQVVTKVEVPEEARSVRKISWDWLCTDGGVVTSASASKYSGIALKVVTVPDGGGTAPTTLYDVTITDEDGVDILCGLGADRSATATEYKSFSDGLGACVDSALTLNVANAGNAKGGKVFLYIA